ncbi:hypothetical protein [Sodalis sp.]|uniref:hypothetical protein n=1 Tax=Sodalis sp. (in: enterobacteria) TaxID=1898979 RepID=UPI003872DAAB
MNNIICSDSIKEVVLFHDDSVMNYAPKLSAIATEELNRAEEGMLGWLSKDTLITDLENANDEIMSLKGELAKWKALAEGQEWLLKDEKDFKKSILDIYEKGLAKKSPAHEILANIVADTYFNI